MQSDCIFCQVYTSQSEKPACSSLIFFPITNPIIKSQVLHFHPPCSKGSIIPATPQLNPLLLLLVIAIINDTRQDPGKFGLNSDHAILDTPNKNPNEVVDTKLGVSNRSSLA
jgi:hypothetical protein